MKDFVDDKIGTVTAISLPGEFQFQINSEKRPIVHDFVVVKHPFDEKIPILAKILKISRFNPLLPDEAAFELAKLQIEEHFTPLPLSGKLEMLVGFCKVLGYLDEFGNLKNPGFPIKPGSEVFTPNKKFMDKVMGVRDNSLMVGFLRNKESVEISVVGNEILNKHIAILAMTGAGKTYAASVILEELIKKGYPLLILDPHGDYVNLNEKEDKKEHFIYQLEKNKGTYSLKVCNNTFDPKELSESELIEYISNASGEDITDAQLGLYQKMMKILTDKKNREEFLSEDLSEQCLEDDDMDDLVKKLDINKHGFSAIFKYLELKTKYFKKGQGEGKGSFYAMYRQINKASQLLKGIDTSLTVEEVEKNLGLGKGVVLNMSALPYAVQRISAYIIVKSLFEKRKKYISSNKSDKDQKICPLFVVVEEAHNFAPASTEGEDYPSLAILRRIATEGRKFGVGLCIISQRPSRVDQTVLSQCNSQMILRVVNPTDQNYIGSIIESLASEDLQALQDLSPGEALISGLMTKLPAVIRVRKRESKEGIKAVNRFQEILEYK